MTDRPSRLAFLRLGLVAGAIVVLGSGPAAAHRLKLFATVEAGEVVAEAFFVGGGRPEGVEVILRDAGGAEIGRGRTDIDGRVRLKPARPGDVNVEVDAGDGHATAVRLAADRFGIEGAGPGAAPATVPTAAEPRPAPADHEALRREIEAAVDRAVARQTRPLLEALERAEARLRFNDVAGGVGMIVGLVGLGLWASARRRRDGPPGDGR
jgi:nickel transport protein